MNTLPLAAPSAALAPTSDMAVPVAVMVLVAAVGVICLVAAAAILVRHGRRSKARPKGRHLG